MVRVMSGVSCVQTGENRAVNAFQLSQTAVFDRGFQHSPKITNNDAESKYSHLIKEKHKFGSDLKSVHEAQNIVEVK